MPIKRIMRDAVLYGLSIAIMKGISLLMLPFVTSYLEPSEFGRLELIGTFTMIASIIAGLGLAESLFRYAGQAATAEEAKMHAARIFGLTLIMGAIVILLAFLLSPYLQKVLPGNPTLIDVYIVISMLALEGIIAVPLGWLRMQNKAGLFFSATLGRAITQALLIIIFLKAGFGVTGVLATGLISAILVAVFLTYWQVNNSGLIFKHTQNKATVIYSLPIVGTGLLAFGLFGLDRWILDLFVTHEEVGLYGVAGKFALATVLLLQPFMMWWHPNRFRLLKENRDKYSTILQVGLVILITVSVAVSFGAPVLIGWIMPDTYIHAIPLLSGLILAMALKEAAELLNIGCLVNDRTDKQFYINLISTFLGVISMLILGNYFGIHGVIIGLNIGYGSKAVLLYLASQSVEPINIGIMPLSVIITLSFILVNKAPELASAWLGLLQATALTVIIPLIAVLLFWNKVKTELSNAKTIRASS